MLWNWNTVDACFLSADWQIRSSGTFAALCIGVIFLVVLLEGLRRAVKEYDRYLRRSYHTRNAVVTGSSNVEAIPTSIAVGVRKSVSRLGEPSSAGPGTPGVLPQATRALLHTLQFAVAYFIML